jgi:hypothetical protein
MIRKHYKSAKNRKKHMRRIAKNEEILKRLKEEKSISILLGAGFSAPMGYPVGNQLNMGEKTKCARRRLFETSVSIY